MKLVNAGVHLFIRHLFSRYQADLSEDSSLGEAEPFSVGGMLCPPSQATPRTSKNVSVLTVSVGKLSSSSSVLEYYAACRWFSLLLSFSVFSAVILSLVISRAADSLQALRWWSLLCVSVLALMLVLTVLIIWRQPQSITKAAFMVRHVESHPEPTCNSMQPFVHFSMSERSLRKS